MAFADKSLEDISLWLREEGFSEAIVDVFKENEVDGEGFLLLKGEDFCSMIKPLGARRKLMNKQNQLKAPTDVNLISKTHVQQEATTMVIPSSGIDEEISGSEGELIELEKDNEHDSTLDDVVIGMNIEIDPTSDDQTRTGDEVVKKEEIKSEETSSAFSHLKKRLIDDKKSQLPLPMPFELPTNYPIVVEEAMRRKLLNGPSFTKFIMSVSSSIFCHKSHPTKAEYHHVIDQILAKYPFIVAEKKRTSGDRYEFLEVALRDKMKYLRNVKPRRKTTDLEESEEAPTAPKKPKPYYPSQHLQQQQPPAGEDKASHMRHMKMLQIEERKVSPNKNIINDLMKRTFHYRRLEIVEEPQLVQQLLKTYPSLKRCDQLLAELGQITGGDIKELKTIWKTATQKIFKMGKEERSCARLYNSDVDDMSDASRSYLAMMILCHLLPDTRMSVDTSRIIVFIQEFADINVEVQDITCPQPVVMVRGSINHPKEAFLVCEHSILSPLQGEDTALTLLGAYYAFNMQYPQGCVNVFSFLEVIFLNTTPPKRTKLSQVLTMYENIS